MNINDQKIRHHIMTLAYDATKETLLNDKLTISNGVKRYNMSLARAHLNALIYEAMHSKLEHEIYHLLSPHALFVESVDKKTINSYLQMLTNVLRTKYDKFSIQNKLKISNILSYIFEAISEFGIIHNYKVSSSISIDTLIKACAKYPKFGEIVLKRHFSLDMDIREVYILKEKLEKELMNEIKVHKIEPFYTLLKPGCGMKQAQLMDVLIGVGIRPKGGTVQDYMIPSKMLDGYSNPNEWFVECSSSNDALILTKVEITRPGTLNKKALGAAQLIYVNEIDDCGTVNYLPFTIKNQNDLNQCFGFYTEDDHLVSVNDTYLIGKTVNLRTPFHCDSKKGICKKCAGAFADMFPYSAELDEFGNPIGTYMGIHIVFKLLGPEGQSFLSAKHHVKAFLELFHFITSDNREENEYIKLEYNVCKFKNHKHIIAHKVEKDEDATKIKEIKVIHNDGTSFIVSLDLEDMYFFVPNKDIMETDLLDEEVVKIYCIVKELGSKFRQIEDLYALPSYDKKLGTNSGLFYHFNEFRKIYKDEHILSAIVLSRLCVRDAITKELPDFTISNNPNAVIESLDTVLKNSPSLGVRLSIGHFGDVFNNPKYYYDDETSLLDELLKGES